MKHVLTVLAFSLLLVGWSPPADAAVGWFKARVVKVGLVNNGMVILILKDLADVPAFGKTSFFAPDLVRKEMLAIGLSALAANLPVQVRTAPDEPGIPEIRIMYLLDN